MTRSLLIDRTRTSLGATRQSEIHSSRHFSCGRNFVDICISLTPDHNTTRDGCLNARWCVHAHELHSGLQVAKVAAMMTKESVCCIRKLALQAGSP